MSRHTALCSCLMTLLLGFGSAVRTQPVVNPVEFSSRTDFLTGANPTRFDIADLNADGKLDIVTANFYTNTTVSVLLGRGDGTFDPHVDYQAGVVPYAVKIADFNGDARPDLAVTNREPATVSILLGNGDGTFQARTAYAAGRSTVTLAVGDYNEDGNLDLAAGSLHDGAAAILLGNGDGTFGSPALYATGFFTYSLVTADFDADGHSDLASVNLLDDSLSVLLGNGDGSFQLATQYPANRPSGLISADLDNDGLLDLAATLSSSNAVLILRGNGNGTFDPAGTYQTGPSPAFMESAGDLNGDGQVDLVVTSQTDNSVGVLLGLGDGSFGAYERFSVGAAPISSAVRDLNGDGRLDVVVSNNAGSSISVLLNAATDTAPPLIALQSRTAANSAGWNNNDVTITWTCSDPGGSGVVAASVTASVTTEGENQVVTGTCRDLAGNTASDTQTGISIDKTPPTLTPSITPIPVLLNGSAAATPGAADVLSGLASASCGEVITTSVGPGSLTCVATDLAGNSSSQSVSYSVGYRFDGFLQPINDTGHSQVCGLSCPVSVFKGGSTVPVKFRLSDANGAAVQSATPPQWVVPAMGGPVTAAIDGASYSEPATSGSTYRWTDVHYAYNWSSKGIAAGYYWRIGVTLDDGQTYFVYIGLK